MKKLTCIYFKQIILKEVTATRELALQWEHSIGLHMYCNPRYFPKRVL